MAFQSAQPPSQRCRERASELSEIGVSGDFSALCFETPVRDLRPPWGDAPLCSLSSNGTHSRSWALSWGIMPNRRQRKTMRYQKRLALWYRKHHYKITKQPVLARYLVNSMKNMHQTSSGMSQNKDQRPFTKGMPSVRPTFMESAGTRRKEMKQQPLPFRRGLEKSSPDKNIISS